jgi:signal transduction histidine kinase
MRTDSYPLEEDPQAERELLLARIGELEHEKAGLERFAAEAAHELLTPLVMIDAYAATAVERLAEQLDAEALDQLDAEALGDLDALRRAAARSRQLVQTLLEHARARRRPLERHPVDVNAVVGETLIPLGPRSARAAP